MKKKRRKNLPGKVSLDSPRYDWVPPTAHYQVARVMTDGGIFYEPHGYLKKNYTVEEMLARAEGHINKYKRGELIDFDSGEPTLAHAAARVMMAIEILEKEKKK